MATHRIDTIVIGAGQAGLSTAYHLQRRGIDFAVLESHDRVGDVWRRRFDALRLYSPAKYDGLPGWGVPGKAWSWPTKDELGDYLEAYVEHFALPVRTATVVQRLSRIADGYLVDCGTEQFVCANVVDATGGWQTPYTPEFAPQIDPAVRQLHSHDYRNPTQLQEGPVLVVGLAHSGGDIALDVSATHPTIVAGRVHGELPFDIEGPVARVALPIMWFAANHVLTERTPIGRKVRTHVRAGGGPLLRVKRSHLAAAGVEHIEARVTAISDGKPQLDDGRVLDVRNIVWCTGFRKNLSWIDLDVTGEDGWPRQQRGCAVDHPGLYFVGLPFQYAFASMLVGGVGRDAAHVAAAIAAQPGGRSAANSSVTRSSVSVKR